LLDWPSAAAGRKRKTPGTFPDSGKEGRTPATVGRRETSRGLLLDDGREGPCTPWR